MMGEGELLTEDGRREPSGPALQAAGLAPLSLEAKEGLSLLNGTQFMAAIGCMLVADGDQHAADGGHELRAVQQAEALFGFEREGREPGGLQGRPARLAPPVLREQLA